MKRASALLVDMAGVFDLEVLWEGCSVMWLVHQLLVDLLLWPIFECGVSWSCDWPCGLGLWWGSTVRYWSLMDLQQVCSAPPSSTIPFPSSSLSYFHCISNTPLFILVPLVSSFIPAFPVSLISIPMSPWSSHLSHIVLSHSCLALFHFSTFVPSPWLSQANPAV